MKKKNKITFTGKVVDHKLKWDSPATKMLYDEFISNHDMESLEIETRVIKDMVTYQQHKFYRGVIIPSFIKATGETNTETIHKGLKGKYLLELVEFNGQVSPFIPSLADLDINQMSDFIESCLQELADCQGSLDNDAYLNYQAAVGGTYGK